MTYYTLGWSYFLFEGITNVLPIMNASNEHVHANFHKILAMALGTLCLIYGAFGFIGYVRYGRGTPVDLLNQLFKNELKYQLNDPTTTILNILFIVNLYCSLPISMYPMNQMIDQLTSSCCKNQSASIFGGQLVKGFFLFFINIISLVIIQVV